MLAIALLLAPAHPEAFFPTAVGSRSVLEVRETQATKRITDTVTKVEEKAGKRLVTVRSVEWRKGSCVFRTRDDVYEVSDRGVTQVGGPDVVADAIPILRHAPARGWRVEQPGLGGAPEVTEYSRGPTEELSLPAGTFRAVRVDSVLTAGRHTVKESRWYAPGVGLVQVTTDHRGNTETAVLTAFTPGK